MRINGGVLMVPGGKGTWGCLHLRVSIPEVSVPGCVNAWGHEYLGDQYLGVLVPRGADTWAAGPWMCWYLGGSGS